MAVGAVAREGMQPARATVAARVNNGAFMLEVRMVVLLECLSPFGKEVLGGSGPW
jgi:hypothetical protein